MARKDYYKILEVPESATKEEIKKSFRRLSKIHHPDKGGNEESFKEINEAYSVIGDEEKKKKYDGGGYDQMNGFPGGGGFGGGFNMDDIFAEFFGGAQRQNPNQPHKGSDLRVKVSLTLHEIFTGVVKKFKYRKDVVCGSCHGTGAADGASSTCQTCNGSGWIDKKINSVMGSVTSKQQCPTCGGSGKIIQHVCSSCGGRKVVPQEEIIDINIPRGVMNGQILSMNNAGNASLNGGANGSLFIIVEELQHEFLNRQGFDLLTTKDISIYDAIFGKELEVDTIDAKIKINIPAGIQSGTRLRMEGKGLYRLNNQSRGDMYMDVFVFIPKDLTEEEKQVLEKIKDSDNIKPKRFGRP